MTDDDVTGDDLVPTWTLRHMPVARLNAIRGLQATPPDLMRLIEAEYAAAREFSEDEEISCDANGGA